MTEAFDVIVIGAGHNGLVCAAMLARAGKSVLVLEAGDAAGGAAATREFATGFRVSGCAHLVTQLQPRVVRELGLKARFAKDGLATIALGDRGEHVRIDGDRVTGVDERDVAAYRDFHKRMGRYAGLLDRHFNRPPPRLGSGDNRDLVALGKLGFDIRRLGRDDMREFLRLIGMNIHDELDERFESPLLKGALALDAVLGTHLGPRSPNTLLTYLYRLAGRDGNIALPAGGMGSVADVLAATAEKAGAEIRLATPVARIVIDNGRVAGVETADGQQIEARTVVSNADPKQTVFQLAGARHFEAGFARRVSHLRASGNAAKLHLALDGLPAIPGLDAGDFGERLVIAPDEHYVEHAFNPAKYGECSPRPVAEINIPTVHDPGLAADGRHVLSAVLQYAPYDRKGGWDDEAKAAFVDAALDVMARVMPDLRERMLHAELLTPADIEREYRITGGHWHHAELTLDQFMFVRPVAGAAQYATPLDGLFLCGAGTHPGGGVSGAPGRNAARAVLERGRSR